MTSGGVTLNAVNFKILEYHLCPNLFLPEKSSTSMASLEDLISKMLGQLVGLLVLPWDLFNYHLLRQYFLNDSPKILLFFINLLIVLIFN
jgi:hypothetical protein